MLAATVLSSTPLDAGCGIQDETPGILRRQAGVDAAALLIRSIAATVRSFWAAKTSSFPAVAPMLPEPDQTHGIVMTTMAFEVRPCCLLCRC